MPVSPHVHLTGQPGCLPVLVKTGLYYGVMTVIMVAAHDAMLHFSGAEEVECIDGRGDAMSGISLAYFIILLLTRTVTATDVRLPVYEFFWLCNVALFFAGFGVLLNRPIMVTSLAVAVGIDQILWYVDLGGEDRERGARASAARTEQAAQERTRTSRSHDLPSSHKAAHLVAQTLLAASRGCSAPHRPSLLLPLSSNTLSCRVCCHEGH